MYAWQIENNCPEASHTNLLPGEKLDLHKIKKKIIPGRGQISAEMLEKGGGGGERYFSTDQNKKKKGIFTVIFFRNFYQHFWHLSKTIFLGPEGYGVTVSPAEWL